MFPPYFKTLPFHLRRLSFYSKLLLLTEYLQHFFAYNCKPVFICFNLIHILDIDPSISIIFPYIHVPYIWIARRGNVPSYMCAQRRLESACASAQYIRLSCPHEETLHHWLSKRRPVKILIKLRECTGWSKPSLDTPCPKVRFLTWIL